MLNEDESATAIAIIENMVLLESAVNFAHSKIQDVLSAAANTAFNDKAEAYGWEHEVSAIDEEPNFIARPEWRVEDEPVGGKYDLSLNITTPGEPNFWITHVMGLMDSSMRIEADFGWAGLRVIQQLMRDHGDIISSLVTAGFRCERGEPALFIPVRISQKDLAQAFTDRDDSLIRAPFEAALDLVHANTAALDTLAESVRRLRLQRGR